MHVPLESGVCSELEGRVLILSRRPPATGVKWQGASALGGGPPASQSQRAICDPEVPSTQPPCKTSALGLRAGSHLDTPTSALCKFVARHRVVFNTEFSTSSGWSSLATMYYVLTADSLLQLRLSFPESSPAPGSPAEACGHLK